MFNNNHDHNGCFSREEAESLVESLTYVFDEMEKYRVLNTRIAVTAIMLHLGAEDEELDATLKYLETQAAASDALGVVDHVRVGLLEVRNKLAEKK